MPDGAVRLNHVRRRASLRFNGDSGKPRKVEFLIEKVRLLDRLRGQLTPRREKALLRMLQEGPEGFKGGLSAGSYVSITGASPATATRDLGELVERKALVRVGERRHARYYIAIPERKVLPVSLDDRGNFL